MGRDIVRVSEDFNERWETWEAPDWLLCEACEGSGEGRELGTECPQCGGHGDIATDEERDADELPVGEGWQVWETVSGGSPVTPVFASAEELIDYLVENGTK